MAHNARIFPDTFYVNGVPIPSSYFQGIDTAQSKALNGDAGGTWANAAAISIGGAGLYFESTLTLQDGAAIVSSGHRITLADSVPQCATSRTIVTSFGQARDLGGTVVMPGRNEGAPAWGPSDATQIGNIVQPPPWQISPSDFPIGTLILPLGSALAFVSGGGVTGNTQPTWPTIVGATVSETSPGTITWTAVLPNNFVFRAVVPGVTGTTEPIWPTVAGATIIDNTVTWVALARNVTTIAVATYHHNQDGYSSTRPGMHLLLPLEMHDGSELSPATVQFTVVNSHTFVPATLPAARLIQVDLAGNITPMSSNLVDTPGGWCYPSTPGSAGAWLGDKVIDLGINDVYKINRSLYRYYCEFKDENGFGALGGNIATSVSMGFDVTDYRFQ